MEEVKYINENEIGEVTKSIDTLYHFTSIDTLYSILSNNKLNANKCNGIDKKWAALEAQKLGIKIVKEEEISYISLTRNPDINWGYIKALSQYGFGKELKEATVFDPRYMGKNSLTTNDDSNVKKSGAVRIIFDGRKLAQKYRIVAADYYGSIDGERVHSDDKKRSSTHDWADKGGKRKSSIKYSALKQNEERIYFFDGEDNGIENLNEYVIGIDVYAPNNRSYYTARIMNIINSSEGGIPLFKDKLKMYRSLKDFNMRQNTPEGDRVDYFQQKADKMGIFYYEDPKTHEKIRVIKTDDGKWSNADEVKKGVDNPNTYPSEYVRAFKVPTRHSVGISNLDNTQQKRGPKAKIGTMPESCLDDIAIVVAALAWFGKTSMVQNESVISHVKNDTNLYQYWLSSIFKGSQCGDKYILPIIEMIKTMSMSHFTYGITTIRLNNIRQSDTIVCMNIINVVTKELQVATRNVRPIFKTLLQNEIGKDRFNDYKKQGKEEFRHEQEFKKSEREKKAKELADLKASKPTGKRGRKANPNIRVNAFKYGKEILHNVTKSDILKKFPKINLSTLNALFSKAKQEGFTEDGALFEGITHHDIDNFSLYNLNELKTIYGDKFNVISEGITNYMNKQEDEMVTEEYIRNIVSEAISRIVENEEADDVMDTETDESGIGTYYTLTLYHNGKKCWCKAYKSLKNAQAKLKKDYETSKNNMRFGQILKVEWVEADEEIEDEVYYTAGGKRKTRPKKMVNDGFVEYCRGGIQCYEVIGEEQGNISELEASDRFSG